MPLTSPLPNRLNIILMGKRANKHVDRELSQELMQAILEKLNRTSPEKIPYDDYKKINKEIDQRLVFDNEVQRWKYVYETGKKPEDIFHDDDLKKSLPFPEGIETEPDPGCCALSRVYEESAR